MSPHPLTMLLALNIRRGIIQQSKQLKTLRGIVFVGCICLFLITAIHLATTQSFILTATEKLEPFSNTRMKMALGFLLGTLITNIFTTGYPIHFNSQESLFLFSAPITRRSLITYKFTLYLFGTSLSSLIILAWIKPIPWSLPLSYISLVTVLCFMQLCSIATRLVILYSFVKTNKLIIYLVIFSLLILVASLWLTVHEPVTNNRLIDNLSHIYPIAKVLLIPFIPLATLIFPDDSHQIIFSIAVITVELVLLLSLIVYFDKKIVKLSCTENTKITIPHSINDKLSLLGTNCSRLLLTSACKFSVTTLFVSQLLQLARSSGKSIALIILSTYICGQYLKNEINIETVYRLSPIAYFLAVFLLPRFVSSGFKSSTDQLEEIKSLPLSEWTISIGMILTPIFISSTIALLFAYASGVFENANLNNSIIIIYSVLGFNILLYLTDSLIALFFPTKSTPIGKLDFDFLGRTFFDFALKSIVLIGVFTTVLIVLRSLIYLNYLSYLTLNLAIAGILMVSSFILLVALKNKFQYLDYNHI